jgi:uncharacterized membrane protein YccC
MRSQSSIAAKVYRFVADLVIVNAQETGAWKTSLRTGIISATTILVASSLFGTSIGPMALFGSMLAQWESGRALLARIKTALIVGTTITGSMIAGVLVAPYHWLVTPVILAIILATSTAYYSFVLTRGPGPLHLFYAAAIGSYFGLFGDIGWHSVYMTGFSCLLTGALTLLYLLPDLHRPEKQAILHARSAVDAFEAAAREDRVDDDLRLLRHRAYFAVNRAWLLFQDNSIGLLIPTAQRGFTTQMLEINRRLGLVIANRHFPSARILEIDQDTPPMLGRPPLGYLFAHGFRRHSIAWFTAWRIGLAAAISDIITRLFALGHPYWAILTSTIVLHLWIGRLATTRRAAHRAIGTMLGLGVVALIVWMDPSPWEVVWLIVGCVIANNLLLPFNYAIALIAITPMSLLSIEAATGGPVHELIHDRLLETLIGVGVAVLVTWASGLREPQRLVRDQFRRTVWAIQQTMLVIDQGRALTPDGRTARVELMFELLSNNAVLSRASAEDRSLRPWQNVESILSDLGYLTLSAYWVSNPAEVMSAHAAVKRLDVFLARLAPIGRNVDVPAHIAAELQNVRALFLTAEPITAAGGREHE